MRVIEAHRGPVLAVAYLPGQRMVSAGWDRTVAVWDVPSGHELRRLQVDHPVQWLAVSPDGRHLALGSLAGLHLWDMTAAPPTCIAAGAGPLAWAPGGAALVSSGTVWSLPGRTRRYLPRVSRPLAVAYGPEGDLIALLGSQVKTFNRAFQLNLNRSFPKRDVVSGAIDPLGRWVCWGTRPGRLQVASLTDRTCDEIAGHASTILGCAFSPDGQLLASACIDGIVRLWDTRDWSERRCLDWGISSIHGVALAADGMTAVAAGFDGSLLVWDLE